MIYINRTAIATVMLVAYVVFIASLMLSTPANAQERTLTSQDAYCVAQSLHPEEVNRMMRLLQSANYDVIGMVAISHTLTHSERCGFANVSIRDLATNIKYYEHLGAHIRNRTSNGLPM